MSEEFKKAEELLSSWETMSQEAKQWMQELGNFGPTYGGQVKGVDIEGCKTYWDAEDLRKCAGAMIEVAQWLENRRSH